MAPDTRPDPQQMTRDELLAEVMVAREAELLQVGFVTLLTRGLKSMEHGKLTAEVVADRAGCRMTIQASDGAPAPSAADVELAAHAARSLGGHLEVQNEAQRVSMVFRRQHPRSIFRADRPPTERSELPVVLVVDDDEDIRDGLAQQLREEGYRVDAAGSADEARQRLKQSPSPDLIMLDLSMPGVDGWQFRDEQLGDPKLATIPVMLLSAHRDVKQVAEQLSAAAYIAKPFDLDSLLTTVRSLVRRS